MNGLDLIEAIILELVKIAKAIDWGIPEPKPEPVPAPAPKPKPKGIPRPPAPPHETKPPRIQNAKLYIPWQDREEWARRLDNAYSVWRGEREYAALLADPKAVARVPHSRKQLVEWMKAAQESHAKSRRLQHRIRNERHRKFKDRSQVRKDVFNAMRDEMRLHTARYASVAALWPITPLADSIQGKLERGIYPGDEV